MTSTEHPTFNCPRCGGEVEYNGRGITQRCKYCGTSIAVPQEFRPVPAPATIIKQMAVQPDAPGQVSRNASAGCITGIIGFVVFMVFVTVVLPLAEMNRAMNSIPAIPEVLQPWVTASANLTREATRRPPTAAPTITPTPAFAAVALQFGEKGTGPGQFTNARYSALDGEGRLYVGEYAGGRIQVFDADGKFLNQFFVSDKDSVLLGLAVDRSGVVYAAGGGDITRWDGQTGKSLGKLKYSGGPGFGELRLAPDGTLYAMWYERRYGIFTSVEGAREDLVHFDADGNVINVSKGVISSITENLALTNFLAVDGRGTLYIAPSREAAIFKFDVKGKFITRLGSSGEGDSQFREVGALAIDGQGRIFMAESGDISVLRPDGSRVGKIDVNGLARCLHFDDAGALWVTTDYGVARYEVKQK